MKKRGADACSSNAGFKRWALGLVKDHPATWGFYVGDELSPTPTNVSQTHALEQEVKSIAPGKPTMYVTIPNDNGVLTNQIQPFAGVADYVGADYYPVGKASTMGGVSNYAEETRQITAGAGANPIFVLQAFSWDSYDSSMADRFPTTQWHLVLTARTGPTQQSHAALAALCQIYWYPLYSFVRRQNYSPEEAQDLTQAFFARLLEHLGEALDRRGCGLHEEPGRRDCHRGGRHRDDRGHQPC